MEMHWTTFLGETDMLNKKANHRKNKKKKPTNQTNQPTSQLASKPASQPTNQQTNQQPTIQKAQNIDEHMYERNDIQLQITGSLELLIHVSNYLV